MTDLSQQAVATFWKEYEDPSIYRVIAFMESVEPWTLDGNPELEEALKRFGENIETLSEVNVGELEQDDLFIRIACNIKTGRALRLLQALDTLHPGSASKLLIHAEESSETPSDPPGIFLRRNIVFERLRLLSRVFSTERFNIVLKALEME